MEPEQDLGGRADRSGVVDDLEICAVYEGSGAVCAGGQGGAVHLSAGGNDAGEDRGVSVSGEDLGKN